MKSTLTSIMRQDLQEWGEAMVRMQDSSILGYGRQSPIGRMIEEGAVVDGGQPPGSRVPTNIGLPDHLQRIHTALKDCPWSLLPIVKKCFLDNKPAEGGELAKVSYLCYWLHGNLAARRNK